MPRRQFNLSENSSTIFSQKPIRMGVRKQSERFWLPKEHKSIYFESLFHHRKSNCCDVCSLSAIEHPTQCPQADTVKISREMTEWKVNNKIYAYFNLLTNWFPCQGPWQLPLRENALKIFHLQNNLYCFYHTDEAVLHPHQRYDNVLPFNSLQLYFTIELY